MEAFHSFQCSKLRQEFLKTQSHVAISTIAMHLESTQYRYSNLRFQSEKCPARDSISYRSSFQSFKSSPGFPPLHNYAFIRVEEYFII